MIFSIDLLTEKVCFAAVSKSGSALRHVPDYRRTLTVCMAAVNNGRSAIAFTPGPMREQVKSFEAESFVQERMQLTEETRRQ